MVSWDCPTCGGSGQEKVIEIRGSKIKEYYADCSECEGYGMIRNGEPSSF